jgi:FMN phosphatase YigB (HAD superfamily)
MLDKFQAICEMSNYGKISREGFYTELSSLTLIDVLKIKTGVEKRIVINRELADYVSLLREESYKIACLSNGTDEWTLRVIEDHNLLSLFDEIIISGNLGIVKPQPDIYIQTLNKLNVAPEETIFVDDRQVNVDAAQKLGISSLLFNNTSAFIKDFKSLVSASQYLQ